MGRGKPVYPSQAVGKSLNMSMLKCFFEIGSDPALFEGLKIVQEKDLCEKYMGNFL